MVLVDMAGNSLEDDVEDNDDDEQGDHADQHGWNRMQSGVALMTAPEVSCTLARADPRRRPSEPGQ
jgi:hypothetical protein